MNKEMLLKQREEIVEKIDEAKCEMSMWESEVYKYEQKLDEIDEMIYLKEITG